MSFFRKNETDSINMRKELSRYRVLHEMGKKAPFTASGSLTVEAALVLPLFLMVMSGFLFLFQVMYFQVRLQGAMDYAVQKAAAYYYAVEQIREGEDVQTVEEADGIGSEVLTWGITAVYLKSVILSELDGQQPVWLQDGGAGLTLLQSQFPDEDGAIDLVVSYRVRIPFLPEQFGTLVMSQRSRRLAWTGTARWKTGEGENEEERLVYVTEHGSVYHLSLECSHLRLSIQSVGRIELNGLRNKNGGKYYPCEKCVMDDIGVQVYVTDSGDRYHSSLSCPGLTRNIRQVPLSEVSLPPCIRCGKEEG